MGIPIPQCEGEHAREALDAVGAPLFPRVHDGFGVAHRAEAVSAAFELDAQFLEVVDLAVERDENRVILVAEWLAPSREIDDREAPMPKAHAGFGMEAMAVGPAVCEHTVH